MAHGSLARYGATYPAPLFEVIGAASLRTTTRMKNAKMKKEGEEVQDTVHLLSMDIELGQLYVCVVYALENDA